jgi:hypothetical protein
MMTMATTPSEQTGIKRTEDAYITLRRPFLGKARITFLTKKGVSWMSKNMCFDISNQIVIDLENVDEIKELMEKDGLTVDVI